MQGCGLVVRGAVTGGCLAANTLQWGQNNWANAGKRDMSATQTPIMPAAQTLRHQKSTTPSHGLAGSPPSLTVL